MTRMANRIVGIGAAAVLGAALLVACGVPHPAETFSLRMGVVRTLERLPYFVIREQGFDTQHGLRFAEIAVSGAAVFMESILAGSADVGYIGSVAVLAAAEGGLIPGKVVPVGVSAVADPDHPGVAVLSRPSVRNWKDLEGQPIAVHAINSLNGVAIKARLQHEGVRRFTFVEIPFANMGLAVAGGNVAAAAMSEPWLTQSLLRGDGTSLGWVIGGPPFEKMEFTLIVFNADVHRKNPRAVKAFLRAHLQAAEWIQQNPDRARSILAKSLELSAEVAQKVKLLRWPLDARNDPALLDGMQPTLVQLGMLKALIPAKGLYDERLLDEVLAERR